MLGALDEIRTDPVADAARTRVQHDPHGSVFVEADLDEVVARAERAQMRLRPGGRLADLRVLFNDLFELVVQPRERLGLRFSHIVPGATVVFTAIVGPAVWNALFDRRPQTSQIVRQVGSSERGTHRHHAATEVDPDGCRNDRTLGRDDRADGRAHAPMDVGHDRDVLMNKRHGGDIVELLTRLILDGHAVDPRLDQPAPGALKHLHNGLSFLFLLEFGGI